MSQFAAHLGLTSMRSRRRPPDMEGKYVDSLDPSLGPARLETYQVFSLSYRRIGQRATECNRVHWRNLQDSAECGAACAACRPRP